jgi:hypothetical protein
MTCMWYGYLYGKWPLWEEGGRKKRRSSKNDK